jgi:predicted transcriptional regulator
MKYRNRTDIMAQMLESAAMDAVTKTKIMYRAYVPHEQLSYYIRVLVENDLLSFSQETRYYHTTVKGQQFLESYSHLHNCIDMRPD